MGLVPVILNEDSLKSGQFTTETQIAWLWDYPNENDTNLHAVYGGFPGDYCLGDLNNDAGFITRFYTPGVHSVLYQVIDESSGEISELRGYNVHVVPIEDFQVIEGEFSAKDEIQTYEVTVDFTTLTTNTAVFGVIRKGKSNVSMTVTDSTGTEVGKEGVGPVGARAWCFIERPSAETTTETYTITMKALTYDEAGSCFRVVVGDKKDFEPIISGLENAVWLDLYSEEKSNWFLTSYTPNRDESWYRFTADGTMVFTLLACFPQIRFQIRDVEDLYVMFDSDEEKNNNVHRSKHCLNYGYGEKARLATTKGQDYYLVVYSQSPISAENIIEKHVNITVGKPHMGYDTTQVFSSSQLTATTSGYSPEVNIVVGDNGETLPRTAVADKITIKSATSGIQLYMMEYWRVKYPGAMDWTNSGYVYPTIDMGYVKDSDNNKNINGIWKISVKASSAGKTFTFVPGLDIVYRYELGD